MASNRRGLGRGLGALITTEPDESTGSDRAGILEVELTTIEPNPMQPRHDWDATALAELALSIREHGLIQPLIVTAAPEDRRDLVDFQIIAGERRWRAAQMAGLRTVPVIVKEATQRQQLEWALVENLQRTDLNPLEAAEAYRMLLTDFGLTQELVAQRVGKSRSAVANSLRLLGLPEELKAAMATGEISEGHARAILGLPNEAMQLMALAAVRRRGLSVRQTEEFVRRVLRSAEQEQTGKAEETAADDLWKIQTQALESDFRLALGTKVDLSRSKRGGRLVIRFFSEEELQRIYEIIVSSE